MCAEGGSPRTLFALGIAGIADIGTGVLTTVTQTSVVDQRTTEATRAIVGEPSASRADRITQVTKAKTLIVPDIAWTHVAREVPVRFAGDAVVVGSS